MNDNRHATRYSQLAVDGDAVGSKQLVLDGRRRRGTFKLRRRLRLILLMFLALSLIPLPILADPAQAADPPSLAPPSPPAKAVALLERLRNGNAKPQAGHQLAAQAKPGPKAKQGKKAKQAKKAKPGKGRKRAKRINRKGCVFEVRKRTWTLVRKCTPKGTIVIPNGYTLNGKNRVMIITGNAAKFEGAVIASGFGKANVRNLRIEGNAGLVGQCQDTIAGIFYYKSTGTIANVTVRNTGLPSCGGYGVYAAGKKVNVLNSTFHNVGFVSLSFYDTVNSTVAGNKLLLSSPSPAHVARGLEIYESSNTVVRNNVFQPAGDDETRGVRTFRSPGLVISGNQFQSLTYGIEIDNASMAAATAQITDNQLAGIAGVGVTVEGGDVQILRNTVGGAGLAFSFGIWLVAPGTGLADLNAISSFGCGIADGSAVVLGGGNTYQDVSVNTC